MPICGANSTEAPPTAERFRNSRRVKADSEGEIFSFSFILRVVLSIDSYQGFHAGTLACVGAQERDFVPRVSFFATASESLGRHSLTYDLCQWNQVPDTSRLQILHIICTTFEDDCRRLPFHDQIHVGFAIHPVRRPSLSRQTS